MTQRLRATNETSRTGILFPQLGAVVSEGDKVAQALKSQCLTLLHDFSSQNPLLVLCLTPAGMFNPHITSVHFPHCTSCLPLLFDLAASSSPAFVFFLFCCFIHAINPSFIIFYFISYTGLLLLCHASLCVSSMPSTVPG